MVFTGIYSNVSREILTSHTNKCFEQIVWREAPKMWPFLDTNLPKIAQKADRHTLRVAEKTVWVNLFHYSVTVGNYSITCIYCEAVEGQRPTEP